MFWGQVLPECPGRAEVPMWGLLYGWGSWDYPPSVPDINGLAEADMLGAGHGGPGNRKVGFGGNSRTGGPRRDSPWTQEFQRQPSPELLVGQQVPQNQEEVVRFESRVLEAGLRLIAVL